MNKIFLKCAIFFLIYSKGYSQVGILTHNPDATLDVNGDVRIQQVDQISYDGIEKILVIDSNDEIQSIDKIFFDQDLDLEDNIYVLISKGDDQKLNTINVDYPIEFDPETSNGINYSQLSFNNNNTQITFPPNKAFTVTGYIGIRGKVTTAGKDFPAFLTTYFEPVGSGIEIVYSGIGYVESSTIEATDSGGVTNPTIMFITGNNGGTIRMMSRYGGANADLSTYNGTVNTNGYYMAGMPTYFSVGTYLIIEEL